MEAAASPRTAPAHRLLKPMPSASTIWTPQVIEPKLYHLEGGEISLSILRCWQETGVYVR